MTTENRLHSSLNIVREFLCGKCGFVLTNLKTDSESAEYDACSFDIGGYKVEYRASKITPIKTGQFVTIWKRNEDGVTVPFDEWDDMHFIVIASISDIRIGLFIFPKSVLVDKGIIRQDGKGGKRGIRVYPSWDIVTNRQAEATQKWQTKYFVEIKGPNSTDIDLIYEIFNGRMRVAGKRPIR